MRTPAERFAAKVRRAEDGCWIWQGTTTSKGYGQFWHDGRLVGAHRFAWEQAHGRPIPEGLVIDHLCRTRNCVNPEHLEPVTTRENTLRGEGCKPKTHCPQRHPYDDENTYTDPAGRRHCRTCQRKHVREAMRRRRSKTTATTAAKEAATPAA
jgi:hypothetical protein